MAKEGWSCWRRTGTQFEVLGMKKWSENSYDERRSRLGIFELNKKAQKK